MKNRRLFLFATLFLFTLLGVPRFVAAVTLLHDVTSNVTGLVNNGCVVPPLVSAFSTASPQVWVYFDFVGSAVGDTVTTTFYRPDGVSYANFNATITGTGSGGFGCYAYFTNISGANAASFPGTWTVKVTYNGSSTPLFSLNFTVTSASVPSRCKPPAVRP